MRTNTSSAALLLAAVAVTGCGEPTTTAGDPSGSRGIPSGPPNILWIIAESKTPAFETLAAEGARFTQAFAAAPDRAAGRSAILTGMHPAAFGSHRPGTPAVPPPHVRSVAETLRAADYFTAFVSHDPRTAALGDAFRPPPGDDAPPGADGVPLGSWDRVGAEAHWRQRGPRQPFFTVFDVTSVDIRGGDGERSIRRILAELDADGLSDTTVVFAFTEASLLAQTDLQIPLAVRWPGRLPAGSVRDDVVTTIDLAPTLHALAGIPVPEHLQGRVFLGGASADDGARASRAATGLPIPADRIAPTGEAPHAPDGEHAQPDRVHPVAARPESYPRGGVFHVAPEVSITCETEGAAIEYTTDRYPPFRWKLYTGPFRIVDWQLRFRCGRLGYHDSETVKYDFDVEFNWWEPRPRRRS